MPTPDLGLSVTGLTARAGDFRLGPVSLAILHDRVLAVLGPSGAGKTMLLETIAGLRPQQSGQITLAGAAIQALPPERRRIGLVFQDAALFPHLTVRENVRFGPRASGTPYPGDVGHLLRQLQIAHLADRSPRSLSGGERQRVALARALAIRPRLLLLDEPLSAIDQPAREETRALLQQLLAELDIPAAHVTHDRDEALNIGDDIAVIVTGQLRQAGPASIVASEPADPDVARLIGWSELGHGTAANGTLHIGRLLLRGLAPAGLHGAVRVFYRPEDVLLGAPSPDDRAAVRFTAHVSQILPTRPLARVSLASDPPITALLLHREVERLHLQADRSIDAALLPSGICVFPAKK
jgi:molybdate transport system ATP-binding protein